MGSVLKEKLKKMLAKYGFSPSKGLGQNFLIDFGAIKKLIEAANLSSGDIVLEIGPGLGVLTKELAKKAKKVIAVEKDLRLVRILNDELRIKNVKNVEVIEGDILKTPYSAFNIQNSYKIVANLPFYLTAPVIRKFLESENPPEEMALIIQKEVAQRIYAKVPDMNLLAVSVQFYAKPKIISYIKKESFWPSPKVDSAIIKITPKNNLGRTGLVFFKIMRAGFSHPRKQLLNNLSLGLEMEREKTIKWLSKNNIRPNQRAETLNIEDWLNLTKTFKI